MNSEKASVLYFVISDLANIDPMYQYSLTYFLDQFILSIVKSEKDDDLQNRLDNIQKFFEYTLYSNVSQSLFVKDKLQFSFLLAVRIMEYSGEINHELYVFLLTGVIGKVDSLIDKPDIPWLTQKSWTNICKLHEFGGVYENMHTQFSTEENLKIWSNYYESATPWEEPIPPAMESKISSFERQLIIKALRPDKLIPLIQNFIIANLGQKFVDVPPIILDKIYQDSTNTTPLIFVQTPGVDPFNALANFAAKKSFNLEKISLGQGQGPHALRLINNSSEKGEWVILQNCHLAQGFMPAQEKRCDELITDVKNVHPDFRLWLTSYPVEFFPSSILQNGIKMTNEPPKGLKNNLKNAMGIDVISDQSFFEGSIKPKAFKSMLFGLVFFHSVITERRGFGPIGWNNKYEFTENDLRISTLQLKLFVDKYPEGLPLLALWYLTAECNYGGKVTDDKDRRQILVLLKDYYSYDIVDNADYQLDPDSDQYHVPPGESYQDFLQYIDDLPLITSPSCYGFHSNASITKEMVETNQLIDTLILTQGAGSGGSGGDSKKFEGFIDSILSTFPEKFNIEEVHKRYPTQKEESMNTVLLQELTRFNKLIQKVKSTLMDLKDAINGQIVTSFELESAMNMMQVGKVPSDWVAVSYPSQKPLGSYLADLNKRIEFFNKWSQTTMPHSFWLSGFFFPQGFLTAALQNYARKYVIEIDHLDFDFEVIAPGTEITEKPEDGIVCYGLYLEGCRFDEKNMVLGESEPKVLFVEAPSLFLKPALKSEIEKKSTYQCPQYRTSERKGVLLTTGHSTNFVMYIEMPTAVEERHWTKRGVAALLALDD